MWLSESKKKERKRRKGRKEGKEENYTLILSISKKVLNQGVKQCGEKER